MAEKPTFKDGFNHELDQTFERDWKARQVKSGALYDAVQTLSAKAETQAPAIFLSQSRIPNAAALNIGNPRLLLTEGIMQVLGNTNPRQVNRETQALIGHELGHLKRGEASLSSLVTQRLAPVYGLPIALVMARHYWLRASMAHPNDAQAMAEHITQQGTSGAWPYSAADHSSAFVDKGALQSLSTDVALAGAGFVGGNYLARYLSLESEYAADRFSAELTSPDAMIGVMQKLESKATRDLVKTISNDDPMIGMLMEKPATNWWEVIQNWTKGNMHAHPSTSDRIARLQMLGGEMKAGVVAAAPASRVTGSQALELGTVLESALNIATKIRV